MAHHFATQDNPARHKGINAAFTDANALPRCLVPALDWYAMVLLAGFYYFLGMFAIGFMLGPLRMFVLTPRVGKVKAVLIEGLVLAPLMPVVARVSMQYAHTPATVADRLTLGAVAWVLLMLAEFATGYFLMRLSPTRYFKKLTQPEGLIGLVFQLLFAVTPLLLLVFS